MIVLELNCLQYNALLPAATTCQLWYIIMEVFNSESMKVRLDSKLNNLSQVTCIRTSVV